MELLFLCARQSLVGSREEMKYDVQDTFGAI